MLFYRTVRTETRYSFHPPSKNAFQNGNKEEKLRRRAKKSKHYHTIVVDQRKANHKYLCHTRRRQHNYPLPFGSQFFFETVAYIRIHSMCCDCRWSFICRWILHTKSQIRFCLPFRCDCLSFLSPFLSLYPFLTSALHAGSASVFSWVSKGIYTAPATISLVDPNNQKFSTISFFSFSCPLASHCLFAKSNSIFFYLDAMSI